MSKRFSSEEIISYEYEHEPSTKRQTLSLVATLKVHWVSTFLKFHSPYYCKIRFFGFMFISTSLNSFVTGVLSDDGHPYIF